MNRKIVRTSNLILTFQQEWLILVLDLDLISTKQQTHNMSKQIIHISKTYLDSVNVKPYFMNVQEKKISI